MKFIGITQRIDQIEGYEEVREALDIKWGELLVTCGYMPIILTSNISPEEYFEKLPFAGIVLSGGNDLFSLSNKSIDKKRDLFEKMIIKNCIRKNIPILGICRGMQMIGEFFGAWIGKVENHIAVRHDIEVVKNTMLYQCVQKDRLSVNSYHKYSIKELDKSILNIASISQDGEIEAIEHRNYPIMAHMWHPEREGVFREEDKAIIKALFL